MSYMKDIYVMSQVNGLQTKKINKEAINLIDIYRTSHPKNT